jgi:hypothetical protein
MKLTKRERALSLTVTLVAFTAFILVNLLSFYVAYLMGVSVDIESGTLFALSMVSMTLAVIGVISNKQSLIIATLITALALFVIGFFSTDLNSMEKIDDAFKEEWIYGAYCVSSLVSDIIMIFCTVAFFLSQLARKPEVPCRICFWLFVAGTAASLCGEIFLIVGTALNRIGNYYPITYISSVISLVSYLVIYYMYCDVNKKVKVKTPDEIK